MARQLDVKYIRLYTDGSAARKVEMPQPRKVAKKPALRKKKKIILHVDPVATLGIVVAVVMLLLMGAGVQNLRQAQHDAAVMESYVQTLQQENAQLQQTYDSGYDLERVEQTALALGMVPVEQVQQMQIHVSVPEPEVQPSGWEQFCTFLAGLFA